MTLRLDFAAASDRGLVRGNNEDSAYAGPNLLALADGMGGHAAGEIASQIMIRHLQQLDADPGDNDMLALLGGVADDANHAIAEHVRQHPETDGMGTTLSALMFNGTSLGLCNVGDSRGYRLRDGSLEQLTVDDTFVQSLVSEGKLDPEDVSTHPQRSLILKAYTGRPVDPTLKSLEPRVGDRLLLCSDGLSDPVTHSTIETTLSTGTPAEAATRLVELALRSGGPDNVTVIIADVVEDPDAATTRALQSKPMTVGALNGVQEDEPRPDTAAGRAAAIARRPQTISPGGQAQDQVPGEAAEPPAAADEEEAHPAGDSSSTGRKLLLLFIVLVVLIALAGGGWWAVKKVQENYYVSTAAEDRIGIWKGADYSVFGRELNETYQLACINERGGLKMVSPADQDDCEPFNLEDLPETTRNSVAGLPGGSYDEVLQQMQRLASSVLPVCVTREGTEDEPAAEEPANSGDRNTPGVDCREVAA